LSTAVALPVEHDPISLAKTIATLDHLSGGRVSVGAGFAWNTDELADHGVPAGRRRTMLREYIEAMRALWTQEEASYEGEFVSFGPSWAWPKPVQSHIPVLIGAAGTEKNFRWIARSADGWITTPRDFDIDAPVRQLQEIWAEAGRAGAPQVVALDFKPVPEKLEHWARIGVTEVLFGLPDKSVAEVGAYVERLAGKLAAMA
jgi:probable F420-dependent oxidoreductase